MISDYNQQTLNLHVDRLTWMVLGISSDSVLMWTLSVWKVVYTGGSFYPMTSPLPRDSTGGNDITNSNAIATSSWSLFSKFGLGIAFTKSMSSGIQGGTLL